MVLIPLCVHMSVYDVLVFLLTRHFYEKLDKTPKYDYPFWIYMCHIDYGPHGKWTRVHIPYRIWTPPLNLDMQSIIYWGPYPICAIEYGPHHRKWTRVHILWGPYYTCHRIWTPYRKWTLGCVVDIVYS